MNLAAVLLQGSTWNAQQQRKHQCDALRGLGQRRGPTAGTVHLRFSGHDLELDFRFATTGERDFLAERHIPLQCLMIAVRQILPVCQCHHQVAAGGKALERSLCGGIRRQLMIRDHAEVHRRLSKIIEWDGNDRYLVAAAVAVLRWRGQPLQ